MARASPAKKARLQQLINAELKVTIPIDRAVFGSPVDLGSNGETFLPMRTDPRYDERFSRPDQGVTYKRDDLQTYLSDHHVKVMVTGIPIILHEIVDQINAQVPIALDATDYIDGVLDDPTLLTIPLHAAPGSLLFRGTAQVVLLTSIQKPMLIETSVGTFPIYVSP